MSKAADEVIDEINVSDEEIKEQTHESSKRRITSKKTLTLDVNFKKIKLAIWSNKTEREYWRNM